MTYFLNIPQRRRSGFYVPSAFGRQLSTIIDDVLAGSGLEQSEKAFSPRLELFEDKEQLIVSAEVPGLNEEDIEITVTKNELSLRGERRDHREQKEGTAVRSEWSYGSFHRVIPVNFEIDDTAIKASFKDGILTVVLPKSKKSLSEIKKIEIQRN